MDTDDLEAVALLYMALVNRGGLRVSWRALGLMVPTTLDLLIRGQAGQGGVRWLRAGFEGL